MAKQGYLGAFYGRVQNVMIDDCDEVWDEYTDADVTVSVDTTDKQEGSASVKLVVAGTVSTGDILATEAISSLNLSNYRRIKLWIKADTAVASGDLQLLLDDTAN